MGKKRQESDEEEPLSGVRRLPQDLEAEQSVLSGLLLASEELDEIKWLLSGEDFFNPAYGLIYQAMLNLHAQEKPIDIVFLRDEMKRDGTLEKVGGAATLAALADMIRIGVDVGHFARVVRDKALQRRLAHVATEILDSATAPAPTATAEELIDTAAKAVYGLGALACGKNGKGPQSLREVMSEKFARMEKMASSQIAPGVVLTGYYELDQMLTGFHGGELIVVAGRPSMGKSTFALNVARRVAVDHGQGVLIFSLEMPALAIAGSMLAAEAHMETQKLRQVKLSNAEFEKLGVSAGKLSEAKVHIDNDEEVSIVELRERARRLKAREGGPVDLIVVDCLQLVQPAPGDAYRTREQEVSGICRGLKAMAMELNVPVIALAQLSRKPTGRTDCRPVMSDLRESGAIEEVADVVLLLHRPDYYDKDDHPGEIEVIIAKQRTGPTGTIKYTFINHQLRIEPLGWTRDLD